MGLPGKGPLLRTSQDYYMIEPLSLAEDGQHMFLHPVNVRCLVREYGSLEQSPEKISATVVEIAGYSMSEVTACLWRWRGRE
jgi:hypothetical protein